MCHEIKQLEKGIQIISVINKIGTVLLLEPKINQKPMKELWDSKNKSNP